MSTSPTLRALSFYPPAGTRSPLRRNRPPNPSERDAILSLIDEDNQFIQLIQSKLESRQKQEKDALSNVDMLEMEVAEAEERLRTAQELYEFFIQTDSKLHRLNKQTPSPPSTPISASPPTNPNLSTSPSSLKKSRTRLSVRSFDTLLKLTTNYNDSTKAALEGSAVAMEEATAALVTCRHNLQAALTVAQMRRDDVELMQEQIRVLKEASNRKRGMFRSIWRVPEEVWRSIFIDLVSNDRSTEGSEPEAGRRHSALFLSLVCHTWRIIAHSTPVLWNDISIPNEIQIPDIQRIKHYYSLCNKSQLSITVSNLQHTPSSSMSHYQHIQRIFDASIPCKLLKCYVRSAGCASLNALLPCLPPPLELHIYRPLHSISGTLESTPAPLIPANYCRTIQNLHIFAAGADWADERSLHLTKYTIVAPPPSAIYGPHRFVPSSIDTLQVIGVEGKFVDSNPPRVELPNVEETVMDLGFLVGVFGVHYRLPRLRRLVIPRASGVGFPQWERFLMGLDGQIEEIECSSMVDGMDTLVGCLGRLNSLATLTIRGDTVDPLLRGLSQKSTGSPKGTFVGKIRPSSSHSAYLEKGLPGLKNLIVEGYGGDGEAVVAFAERRVNVDGVAKIGELRVALRSCTRVGSEVMSRLKAIVSLIP